MYTLEELKELELLIDYPFDNTLLTKAIGTSHDGRLVVDINKVDRNLDPEAYIVAFLLMDPDLTLSLNQGAIIFSDPSYTSAIIGYSDNRILYSYDDMIESLMFEDNITMEDAIEFIEYNTINSLPYYPTGPIVVYPIDEQ